MRISDCHICVGILLNNTPNVLFIGDSTGAQKAMDEAGPEYAEVGVVAHPIPVFPRYPVLEQPSTKTTVAPKKGK